MKKTFGTVMLTAALLVSGGTGLASASETHETQSEGQAELKCGGNMDHSTMNFGQMKEHIQQMHPGFTNKEMNEHYKKMHGTGGSSNSNNFQKM